MTAHTQDSVTRISGKGEQVRDSRRGWVGIREGG